MKRLRWDQYLWIGVITFILLTLPLFYRPVKGQHVSTESDLQFTTVAPIPLLQREPAEVDAFMASVSAQAVQVIDVDSGSVLLSRNADLPRSPASTTKLVTALVSRDIYALDTVLKVGQEAMSTGTTMGLINGEEITVENVFYGLLMNSGNDAAFLLANQSPFGYQSFVNQMNVKAEQLHLKHSHFTNPSGLDDPDHVMSAADLTIVAREVLKDEFLKSIVGTKSKVITDVSGKISHPLYSTQQLLGIVPGVIGMKTGTTDQAGEALVTALERDGHTLILVVLGSQDRYADTRKMINWIENSYQWVQSEDAL